MLSILWRFAPVHITKPKGVIHLIESNFLVDKDTLFQSLEADTANVRPPSVSLLYLGQLAL